MRLTIFCSRRLTRSAGAPRRFNCQNPRRLIRVPICLKGGLGLVSAEPIGQSNFSPAFGSIDLILVCISVG
jgi:hypothetical protein